MLNGDEVKNGRRRELRVPVCSAAGGGLGLIDSDLSLLVLVEVAEHARVELEVIFIVGEKESLLVWWYCVRLVDLELGYWVATVP